MFIIVYFYFCFRKVYRNAGTDVDTGSMPDPASVITDKPGFIVSTVIFLITVMLLVTHSMTHLSVAAIGTFTAIVTLLANIKHAKHLLKLVDYKTLLFFVGLFIVVSGLEETGVLELISGMIQNICGNNLLLLIAIIIWVSGVASAFVDNIPFAATMVPVIKKLSESIGIDINILAYSLAMGTDIGGSATPIGASANVVGISVASKEGYPIGWGQYCKYMAPATIIVLAISMLTVWVRYIFLA